MQQANWAINDLKYKQLEVVEVFVKGQDVFALLLMGYGKSLYYKCLAFCVGCLGCTSHRYVDLLVHTTGAMLHICCKCEAVTHYMHTLGLIIFI